jgi:hypothetical protein
MLIGLAGVSIIWHKPLTDHDVSARTVENHRQHLTAKLNIHDTAGLTRHPIAAGIIESSVQMTIVQPA